MPRVVNNAPTAIGTRMRELGLSKAQLSAMTQGLPKEERISLAMLRQFLNQGRTISLARLQALCRILSISITYSWNPPRIP